MVYEKKLLELEKIVRLQERRILTLIKQVKLLERENSRRKTDIAKLESK